MPTWGRNRTVIRTEERNRMAVSMMMRTRRTVGTRRAWWLGWPARTMVVISRTMGYSPAWTVGADPRTVMLATIVSGTVMIVSRLRTIMVVIVVSSIFYS